MMMMIMNSTTVVLLTFLVQLFVVVTPQGVQIQPTQLTANSPVHCEDIIEVSTFEGNCCSLNVTDGNGCVLNVVNGRCVIKGQYWTLDYASTLTSGGAQCPPSQYPNLGETQFPTMAPVDSGATSTVSEYLALIRLFGTAAILLVGAFVVVS